MATFKHLSRKIRLAKKGRQTKWAPFWAVLKKFGKGRQVHPGRITAIKRSWRRTKTKA
jgi:ribosomal protein L39E